METYFGCIKCLHEAWADGIRGPGAAVRSPICRVPITSKGISEWTCPNGHRVLFWAQPPFYGRLFAKALYEVAERDMRSAVLDFYSAWENFVSFTVAVLLADAGVTAELKGALRRSEPLLGMYLGLCSAKTGKLPAVVDEKVTKLRNSVVHDDALPSEGEALAAGRAVQWCILSCLSQLEPLHSTSSAIATHFKEYLADLKRLNVDQSEVLQVGNAREVEWDIELAVTDLRERPPPR